jgi:hypothetical protein
VSHNNDDDDDDDDRISGTASQLSAVDGDLGFFLPD